MCLSSNNLANKYASRGGAKMNILINPMNVNKKSCPFNGWSKGCKLSCSYRNKKHKKKKRKKKL